MCVMTFLSERCVVWSSNCNKCVRFRRSYLCDAIARYISAYVLILMLCGALGSLLV